MKFYELKLKLSGDGRKSSVIAGPSPGYYPNGNQGEIPMDEFVNEKTIVFDKLIFSGGKRVRVTDFIWHMDVDGLGYVISDQIKEVFKNFNLPEHRFYKLPIYEDVRNKKYQFYILHMLQYNFDYSLIDFEKSTFYLGNFFKENKKIVKYENDEKLKNFDFLEEKVWGHNLILNNKYEELNLDCFHIHHLYNSFIVSERLKKALEDNNATGIEFKDTCFRT